MNTQTQEALNQPVQRPLKDILRDIPLDACAWYKHKQGAEQHIPYGGIIHEALAEIERLEALKAKQVCQANEPYGYVVEFDGIANLPEFYFEKNKAQNEANHCLVGAKVKPLYTKEQL